MKRPSKPLKNLNLPPTGQAKAILRGGTFNRVQVLVQEGQSQLDHGGLTYKVTRQKDAQGRIICTWGRL